MSFSFGAGVRDSLSNLAASLGAGKDKAAHDAFFVFDLDRAQIEAIYQGDWLYELYAAREAPLRLHPSRVVRFLGNPLPDPSLSGHPWSDSVLQALYDAVHAAALTTAGATSLMHEAKVDVVTVPNLSEHLSSAETTEQLSARFAYAAAMKSINNLLLLGDGESWSRQSVDFGGLPEMVRTFLQVAAGAADIPVTRLLGQSPAGLSATGDSDTRNYYDMIAARQELDLRPQLERLDRLICRSEGIDPGALSFAFRPLWQLDGSSKAALALSKAQATQIYAGLGLWPAAVTAKLVEAQLVADGTYPNAAAVFAEGGGQPIGDALEVGATPRASGGSRPGEGEPRDWHGRWTTGAQGEVGASVGPMSRAAALVQGRQLAGPLPVGGTPSGTASVAAGQGAQAPDGTPVDLASSRDRARALARALAALAAAARSARRWLPEEPEEPEPPLPNVDPGLPEPRDPPADEPEKPPSKPLPPHSSLPDTEREDVELPAGVTPQEAKELHLKGSPVGISLEVRGNNTTELGDSYSDPINVLKGAQKAPSAPNLGGSKPDGILTPQGSTDLLCVEAKFFEKWSESLYRSRSAPELSSWQGSGNDRSSLEV